MNQHADTADLLAQPSFDFNRLGQHLATFAGAVGANGGSYFAWVKACNKDPAVAARLDAMDPVVAEAALRLGAGLEIVPDAADFRAWLEANAGSWSDLLSPALEQSRLTVLDLGSAGSGLANALAAQDRETAQSLYDALMQASGHEVAIGPWLEKRTIYSTDNYISAFDRNARRNLHLGLDVFVPAGTVLSLPLAGTVVQTMVMNDSLDYGGVLVLEHEWQPGKHFWSLWGHLTHQSARDWKIGDRIAAATPFATVGDFEENGWWIPHLHLQLLRKPYLNYATAPGVGEEMFAALWPDLFPDPSILVVG